MILCWGNRKVVFELKSHSILLISLTAIFFLISGDVSIALGQDTTPVSGITEAIRDVTLSLSVEGTVSTILLGEGATVKEKQTILELENRLETLEVKRRKLIWKSRAEVEAAKAKVVTLKSLLDSTQKLFESTRSVSREELQERELQYKLAVAENTQLETEEERQKIEYEMALENLRKRRLESPINGTIIKVSIEEGESCEPQQPLVRVVDTSKCLLVCNIEESLGRTLNKGEIVVLEIKTGNASTTKKGTIAFASPVADPASGLLEIKVEFDNQDGMVRPGVSGFMLLTNQ
ncbi:efflux RND transporter periplasmic adaptor subunit [Thermodesulfobacteriota bacterium]